MSPPGVRVSVAGADDAATVAGLLHDFNTEYASPSPGVDTLTTRLPRLLAGDDMFALLAVAAPSAPPPGAAVAIGCALVSLRPTVWAPGPVATLDELYVVPGRRDRGIGTALLAEVEAQTRRRGARTVEIIVDGDGGGAPRFYERHGYRNTEPGDTVRLLYYFREL